MATTVALPAVRRGDLGADRLRAFHAIEHRFVWQARAAVLLVGASGLYMVAKLDLWGSFRCIDFSWMPALVCVWPIFALLLFVGEPFILHRRFPRSLDRASDSSFTRPHHLHSIALPHGLVT